MDPSMAEMEIKRKRFSSFFFFKKHFFKINKVAFFFLENKVACCYWLFV